MTSAVLAASQGFETEQGFQGLGMRCEVCYAMF